MPTVEAKVTVPVEPGTAFAVSQSTGKTRLLWDPFIRHQHFVDGATAPDKGVRTFTRHRAGPSMVSEYVSYAPPTTVGMKMVTGPWFFASFAGGWQFRPVADRPGHSEATWRYSFKIRPSWLARLGDPLGRWILSIEIRRRIVSFARGCEDPRVIAAVQDGTA